MVIVMNLLFLLRTLRQQLLALKDQASDGNHIGASEVSHSTLQQHLLGHV